MLELNALPSARRYFRKLVPRLIQMRISIIRAPERLHDQIYQGLADEIKVAIGSRPIRIKSTNNESSPAQAIAIRTPRMDQSIRTAFDFSNAAAPIGKRFIIYGLDRQSWRHWRHFFHDVIELYLGAAFEGQESDLPNFIVLVPPGIPMSEYRRLDVKDTIDWKGVVTRNDAAVYADTLHGPVNGLVSRAARETSIELAGWNLPFLESLLNLEDDIQINPLETLKANIPSEPIDLVPTWETGLVDWWSEEIRIDTTALLNMHRFDEVEERLWRAHVRSIFEVVDIVRLAILQHYRELLQDRVNPQNPLDISIRNRVIQKTYYRDLELGDLIGAHNSDEFLTSRHERLVKCANAVRIRIAHMKPVDLALLHNLAALWEEEAATVLSVEHGWEWPRCGQTLTVMVGPAGAGKTTWARKNQGNAFVVSRDDVREQLSEGTPSDVEFARFRSLGIKRLSEGQSVIMDATHIRPHRRLAVRRIAPPDIKVRYVVIDRPLEEKIETGGWRNEGLKDGMILEMHNEFQSEREVIMNGDGDNGVEIIDMTDGTYGTADG